MNRHKAERIELTVDAGAAALLAAAVVYAVYGLLGARMETALVAAASFGVAFAGLQRIAPVAGRAMLEPLETPVTKLLAEADRSIEAAGEIPLLLDDVLTAPNSGSRVVQLFDAAAMQSRSYPRGGVDNPSSPPTSGERRDDSKALHQALSDLRRSLS